MKIDGKLFLEGNLFLLICCGCYLAWWLVAFHPQHGVRGIKTGWLLVPAALTGVLAVARIMRGIAVSAVENTPVPTAAICVTGGVVYAVLLALTWILMKRPVTTELFLIVGWATLVACELNVLYALGCFGKGTATALLVVTLVLAVVSMVCYLAYYHLDAVKGYYDGAVPLVLVAAETALMLATLAHALQ